MKKVIFIITLFLSCNNLFSQTYEVRRVDDKPIPRTYSPTISTLDVAEETGRVQSQLQARYDSNFQKVNSKISSISKILSKMIQRHKSGIQLLEGERLEYINDYINNLENIKKINYTNNSSVSQVLNYLDKIESQLYDWL
jgi:hypothetical protein